MLTASDELHKYLTDLGDDGFLDFTEKVGFMKSILTHHIHPTAGSFDTEQSLTIREWLKREKSGVSAHRNGLINEIVATQHNDPPLFDRACRIAGIRTDAARTLLLSEQAVTTARRAKWWAMLAAVLSVVTAETIKYLVSKEVYP